MNNVVQTSTYTTNDENPEALVKQIIDAMWLIIKNDKDRATVKRKAKELQRNTQFDTIKEVYKYVVQKVPYKNDPEDAELITAPSHLIKGNVVGGDCDDMCILLAALLIELNIPVKFKTIYWRESSNGYYSHVVCEANDGKKWITLDPTRKGDGFGKTVPSNLIKRQKKFTPPSGIKNLNDSRDMEIRSLNDGNDPYLRLADCGCNGGGQISDSSILAAAQRAMQTNQPVVLSDCGCGCGGSEKSKCAGKKRKNAENINTNTNPVIINIGNTDKSSSRSDKGFATLPMQANQGNNQSEPEKTKEQIKYETELKKREPVKITTKKKVYSVPNRPFY